MMSNKIAYIENEEQFIGTKFVNIIGGLFIWVDILNNYCVYYFRKSWKNGVALEKIKEYQGSSLGNDKPSLQVLEALSKSTKQPKIKIFHHNVDKCNLEYLEKRVIAEHNYPFGGHHINSKDCFNKAWPIGNIPFDSVISDIAYDKLDAKMKRHNDKDDPFEFEKKFKPRDRIKLLKDNKKSIQARDKRYYNENSVGRYATQMKKRPVPEDWLGHLWELEPKNPNEELETILDGSQGGEACVRVPKMKGLFSYVVPYEDHYLILESDLEVKGNDLNGIPRIQQDYVKENDILKMIRKTIKTYKLVSNKGMPLLNHMKINKLFKNHHYDDKEINKYKGIIKNEYEKDRKKSEKDIEGSNDYSDKALEANNGDNPNNKDYKKLIEKIKTYLLEKYNFVPDFTTKFSDGFEEKIQKYTTAHVIKTERTWPKKTLALGWFNLIKDYEKNVEKIDTYYKHIKFPEEVYMILLNPSNNALETFDEWFENSLIKYESEIDENAV